MDSSAGAQFSESDIHSALAEVDRGLRSPCPSDQYEVIAKMPSYVARFPFPLFINASFLKLAEAFHLGSNLVRGSILRVLENCASSCLDKLISVDEILRRVLSVSLSNDPVARGLCLRCIGQLVPLVAHRKNLHHLVSSSLRSSDEQEMIAAIHASSKFASYSKEFSASILDEVSELMVGVQTPLHIKLLLVTVLSHMHADTSTTCAVVRLCKEKLLANCSSKPLLIRLLGALTTLACDTFAIVGDQLQLLIDLLANPTSRSVVNAVLANLCLLAKHSPHVWNQQHVQTLIAFADCYACGEKGIQSAKLIVTCFHHLLRHPFAVSALADCKEDTINMCNKYCFNTRLCVALEASQCLLCIAKSDPSVSLINASLSHTICQLSKAIQLNDTRSLKKVLDSVILLSDVSEELGPSLCLLLQSHCDNVHYNSSMSRSILQALLVLSHKFPVPIDWVFNRIKNNPQKNTVLFNILLSDTGCTNALNDGHIRSIVESCSNLWVCFQLCRLCMRYAQYNVAKSGFHKLCDADLGNQCYYLWLKSLSLVSNAESDIINLDKETHFTQMLSVFENMIISYDKAITSMHVARSYTDFKLQPFSVKFLKCRYIFLVAVRETIVALNCARIEKNDKALKEVGCLFKEAQVAWKELSKCCFDADVASLQYLRVQYIVCTLAYKAAMIIAGDDAGPEMRVSGLDVGSDKQSKCVLELLIWASDILSQAVTFSPPKAKQYATSAINALVLYPFSYPRFFFQSLQETKIMLHLWPQTTGTSAWVTVPSSQAFALKVEGVLQYMKRTVTACRSVKEVIVQLNFYPPNMLHNCDDLSICSKKVSVNKDYFTAEFVLDLKESGLITVNPEFIDSQFGQPWNSQMETSLRINVIK